LRVGLINQQLHFYLIVLCLNATLGSHLLINKSRVNLDIMKNTDTNFDIEERVRRSIFINRSGDWTSFTNGQGTMTEQLGAYLPEFLIFVEIYNLEGELILNYPVEQAVEAELEEAMKRQVLLYGKLMENVGVSTVAVETSLVESAEWFAFEHFKSPEFLIVEALERAEKLAEPGNEQLSYLDLIKEFENQQEGVETPIAPLPNPPRPALCENPAEYQTIALPVVMRAKSVRVKSVDDTRKGEVDAANSAANSTDNAEPSTQAGGPPAAPVRDNYSTAAKAPAGKSRRTWSTLRDITGIVYALLSWTLLRL